MKQTRWQYMTQLSQRMKRKIGFDEALEMLKRQIKRKAIADGLIVDPAKRPPRFSWAWEFAGQSGIVEADSRSDARGLIKTKLGITKKDRLPVNTTITRMKGNQES